MTDIDRATQAALNIRTVKHVRLSTREHGGLGGTVYDESVGIEFDVRTDGCKWNVNDDDGRTFSAFTLRRALRKAIAAN